MNLSTRKGVNGPVLFSPSIRHFLTVLALWHSAFVVLVQACGAKCCLGIFSSISDSPQRWSRPCKGQCPSHACRDLCQVLPISLGEQAGQKPYSHGVEPGYRDEAELDLLQWRLLVGEVCWSCMAGCWQRDERCFLSFWQND